MNSSTKNRLKQIFAKEINKNISEFTLGDMELFEDWIATGFAAEHIKTASKYLEPETSLPISSPLEKPRTNTKCRNCDNLVINLVNKIVFDKNTLQLVIYCSYWLYKNKIGYKNALYNVSLNDISCTQFLSHKNVLDHSNIDVSDLNYIPITSEDLSIFPLASFVDKGYNIEKINEEYFLVKGEN